MTFRPFYLGCLAQASYLVGDGGVAAVIDPQRDVDQYLDEARRLGLRIEHVIETHLHADFVSGHVELAARTGATIWLGPGSGATFPHRVAHHGVELRLGELRLRFLETPGHTPESISVLLLDGGRPRRVLTGDALFVGDVGRPDLVAARGHTPEEMASRMYETVHDVLLRLPDDVEVWPAHGAGSACGRAIGDERSSTIGRERLTNWALAAMGRDAFVRHLTTDLPPAPAYFGHDAEMNRSGAPALGAPAPLLSAAALDAAVRAGAQVIDVRDAAAWSDGHVPGSLNLGLHGSFASWAGTLVPTGCAVALVADDAAAAHEAQVRLARVGIERVVGALDGGMAAWRAAGLPVDALPRVDPTSLADALRSRGAPLVVDVRRPHEFAAGHVPGAVNLPLDALAARAAELDATRPVVTVCGSGYRSSAAAGLLQQLGQRVSGDLAGGWSAWTDAGMAVESEVAS